VEEVLPAEISHRLLPYTDIYNPRFYSLYRYCRQKYPKNATFEEIGKASATRDKHPCIVFICGNDRESNGERGDRE